MARWSSGLEVLGKRIADLIELVEHNLTVSVWTVEYDTYRTPSHTHSTSEWQTAWNSVSAGQQSSPTKSDLLTYYIITNTYSLEDY